MSPTLQEGGHLTAVLQDEAAALGRTLTLGSRCLVTICLCAQQPVPDLLQAMTMAL